MAIERALDAGAAHVALHPLSRNLRRALAGVAIGLAVLLATAADAREPAPVTLGEVATRVHSPRLGDVVELLRRDAQTELAAIDWSKRGVRRKVSVSASLVRLDSVQERGLLRADATVSATLRDARTGALLAILEGRARAEDRPVAAAGAERDALAAAVRGAITAIPEAIRRMQ
jgi:hypothetical protein